MPRHNRTAAAADCQPAKLRAGSIPPLESHVSRWSSGDHRKKRAGACVGAPRHSADRPASATRDERRPLKANRRGTRGMDAVCADDAVGTTSTAGSARAPRRPSAVPTTIESTGASRRATRPKGGARAVLLSGGLVSTPQSSVRARQRPPTPTGLRGPRRRYSPRPRDRDTVPAGHQSSRRKERRPVYGRWPRRRGRGALVASMGQGRGHAGL